MGVLNYPVVVTTNSQTSPGFGPVLVGRYFAAQQFLTRLPVPKTTPHAPADLAASAAFFPLVGVLVGSIAAGLLWVVRSVADFPPVVGALVAVSVAVTLTGFFHEDAFADVCDAFGGYTPERRREIMRDSRVGSFGATGIGIVMFGELALLSSLSVPAAVSAIICAHTVGRWASVLLTAAARYVSDPESLAKPYAEGISLSVVGFATLTASAVTVVATNLWWTVGLGIVTVALVASARWFFARWLGGITGDCLGAINKLMQVLVLCAATHPRFAVRYG